MADLPDSVPAIQIDQVNGELHEEGVYGFTGEDPQAFSGSQPRAPQQALATPGTAVGHFQAGGKHSMAGEICDLQAGLRGWRAALSETIPRPA